MTIKEELALINEFSRKELSEDDVSSCEADVEKTVSGYMTTLETIISAKEKELMSI